MRFIPQIVLWTAGAVGAYAVMRFVKREYDRVNQELEAARLQPVANKAERDAHPTCGAIPAPEFIGRKSSLRRPPGPARHARQRQRVSVSPFCGVSRAGPAAVGSLHGPFSRLPAASDCVSSLRSGSASGPGS